MIETNDSALLIR